jgi:putative peptidoglycan lipid II flippase
MTLVRRLVERVFPRGALVLSIVTLVGYVLGFVRDIVQARTFGAGADLDAYNAAFQIPEIALGVLVASGLSAPFVPLFLGLREHDRHAADRFVGTILTLASLIAIVAIPILWLIAPATVDLVGKGFDVRQRDLYVDLFRLMLVTPMLFAISDVLGELLIAERRFLGYALAPVLYNLGIVGGSLLLGRSLGVHGAAIGAIVGAAAHLAIRLVAMRGSPVRFRRALAIRTPEFRQFLAMMVPRMASHPIDPLTFTQLGSLASTVAVGGLSSLSFARNFQSVPVSVIAVSFALAVFPSLSIAAADGRRDAFTAIVVRNSVAIIGLTTLAGVALAVLARLVIEVFFRGGAFTQEGVDRTHLVLVVLCLAIPFESVSHLLSRAIFATRNTILQVLASVGGYVVVIVAANVLTDRIGIAGVALAFAIGMAAKAGLLTLALIVRIRTIGRDVGGEAEVAATT